ncbi:MAG: molybdopterin-dependent oxidoreductase [Spirochaetales bacterium]|nr:molybdopterin-dependent oxidoreductase [Spirochaetales bacterium]
MKMIYDREWSIRESYKRPPYSMEYKIGLSSNGILQAIRCRAVADSGSYTSTTPWSTWRSVVHCCGPYRVPHVHTDIFAVATHNVYAGAFRGFGTPPVNFATEQLMDMAAEKCGLDPVEFRIRNILSQGDETVTGQVLDNHTVSTRQVMVAVLEKINFQSKVKNCSFGKGDTLYGIGFAVAYRGASVGAEAMDFCSCTINCQFDGSILLETGIYENGQGSQSAMILVLADELSVETDRIRYAESTTSRVPEGGTTVASRGTLMGSGAVVAAAKKLKKIIADVIAPFLGCESAEVIFRDGYILNPHGSTKLSWPEAMQLMHEAGVYPFAFGSFRAPEIDWDEETGEGRPYFTYVYSCQAAEVSIEKATGKITLLNVVAGHDIGKAVNPGLLNGQIFGGVTQGAGMALMEDLHVEDGITETKNFNTYKIPKAVDMPEITALIIENADPNSPFGCKGIGEPALELIAPAIANAVYRATGIRHFELPIKVAPSGADHE